MTTAETAAQAGPRLQISHTTEDLRGVRVVSREVAWASGTHGTFLRTTDGGRTWSVGQVPDAAALDFRGVVAFSADEAFLMSAGPGELSRIYHTGDGGAHWTLQFTNTNPKGFFDSIAFWDRTHGVVLGDPVPDNSGKLKFEVLVTEDGQNWRAIPAEQLPPAIEGEGAFAASNTCVAILTDGSGGTGKTEVPRFARDDKAYEAGSGGVSGGDSNVWFATGGKVARVFHSADRGRSWQVFDTPIIHGPDSAGIFSIAFRDARHGVIAGGDYKHPNDDGPNLAFTADGGKSWRLSGLHPLAYFSAGLYGKNWSEGKIPGERVFLVGQDFVFDVRPSANPRRVSGKKSLGMKFNAASAVPGGGALVVGAKGLIAVVP